MLSSNANCPLITKPTRATASLSTIIDHIITNRYSYPIYPGITECNFTDHYPVFCMLKNRVTGHCKRPFKSFYRSVKNFDSEQVLNDLNNKVDDFNFHDLHENNFYQVFDQFLKLITSNIDFHAPLKLASRTGWSSCRPADQL